MMHKVENGRIVYVNPATDDRLSFLELGLITQLSSQGIEVVDAKELATDQQSEEQIEAALQRLVEFGYLQDSDGE